MKTIDRVVRWMTKYAHNAGIKSLVVGVSGGVDSAVIERLCERTGLKVVCVAMPMWLHENSDPTAMYRAMELCVGRTNVEFHVRQIGPIVEAYATGGVGESELRQGNLRSRIRANILYDFAAVNCGLVVGTGNKDEDEIGYFTKGGDGLVDICPLSKFHKHEVYSMAAQLDVPESIQLVAPTAGLWDGQTDEQELGMTYAEVAWAIDYQDGDEPNDELTTRQYQVLDMVRDRRRKNAHKLHYPPVFDPDKDELCEAQHVTPNEEMSSTSNTAAMPSL